jgi:macrolide transport system ATP-binding/permease protein
VQLGFNRENVLLFTINARQAGYRDQALARFYDNLRDQLRTIPGARNVTSSGYPLVSGSMSATGVEVPAGLGTADESTATVTVGAAFVATMQIPILLGRDIDGHDQSSGAKVAVVNEVFAKKYFGSANPIGRRIKIGRGSAADIEIVGVCKAARLSTLKDDIPTVVYLPYGQRAFEALRMNYELRSAGDPMALAGTVRRMVHQADSRIPVADVSTQSGVIDQTISEERTFATLCTWFALLAVLIGCVGLYGTMAYSVARRTNEIGVRMALGARRGRLVWMVPREVMTLSAAGLAIGLPLAYALSHVVESYLFGMKAHDALVPRRWLRGTVPPGGRRGSIRGWRSATSDYNCAPVGRTGAAAIFFRNNRLRSLRASLPFRSRWKRALSPLMADMVPKSSRVCVTAYVR